MAATPNINGEKIKGSITGITTISVTTISATTYQNLPTDVFVTGGTFNSGTGTATFTNNTGGTFNVVGFSTGGGTFTGGTVNGATIFTNGLTANTLNVTGSTLVQGDISGNTLFSTQSIGDEGGQLDLFKPQTNTSISGVSVTIDVYQNRLRFFESGSPNRGAYIDITAATAGVGSDLLAGGTSAFDYGKAFVISNSQQLI